MRVDNIEIGGLMLVIEKDSISETVAIWPVQIGLENHYFRVCLLQWDHRNRFRSMEEQEGRDLVLCVRSVAFRTDSGVIRAPLCLFLSFLENLFRRTLLLIDLFHTGIPFFNISTNSRVLYVIIIFTSQMKIFTFWIANSCLGCKI